MVPTYAAPTPPLHGKGLDRLEPLEHLGAHPPAPSTTIVPRLPSARIQGFQVTQKPTTTQRPVSSTTVQSTTTTTSAESSDSEEEVQSVELQPQPVIKEVIEEKVSKGTQEVDLEKFHPAPAAPRAQEPTREFDQEMLGSGAGSGSEFEEESQEATSEEVAEELQNSGVRVEAPVFSTTTTTEEPTTEAPEAPESPETTTPASLKKIQIRPRGPASTSTTTVPTTTSESPSTTTTSESPTTTTSEAITEASEAPEAPEVVHTTRPHPETITSLESGELVSDFAFNSDEDTSTHDDNMEIVETTESIHRASGSKTLEAVKAVETVKQHKQEEDNGISRKIESINIDVPG